MPKQQDEEKQVVVVPPKYEDLYFEYISGQSVTAPVRGNNILSLCEFQDIVTAWQTSWLLSSTLLITWCLWEAKRLV